MRTKGNVPAVYKFFLDGKREFCDNNEVTFVVFKWLSSSFMKLGDVNAQLGFFLNE